MIVFKKLTKKYNHNFTALDGVDLEIKDGEFVSLVGPSGAGKSTLIKMLTKEDKPTSGRVLLDDVDLADVPDKEIPFLRRKIGMIFQDFRLLESKNAFENVAFALEVSGTPEKYIAKDVEQVLAIVGLAEKQKNFPRELSGGEKQRLALARALVHRPKIILADEPTGNLDLVNSYDVLKLLWRINELGTTVILATHDIEIVNTAGKRVVSMDKGKIVRDQLEAGKYIL